MAKLLAADYPGLKSFFRFFSERFIDTSHLPAADRPLALLEECERTTPAQASSSLRMGVNNCLEMSGHWQATEVAALDAQLLGRGLLTLSQVRQRHWGRYAAVLKREHIRTDAEYDMVQGVLCDPAMRSCLDERRQLEGLVAAYESGAR